MTSKVRNGIVWITGSVGTLTFLLLETAGKYTP